MSLISGAQVGVDKPRRTLLLSGLAAIAADWLPKAYGSSRNIGNAGSAEAGAGSIVVPPDKVSLATYGGMPGANPDILKRAFSQAFSALKEKDGGTLLVPAGLYDFGRYADSA